MTELEQYYKKQIESLRIKRMNQMQEILRLQERELRLVEAGSALQYELWWIAEQEGDEDIEIDFDDIHRRIMEWDAIKKGEQEDEGYTS